MDRDCRTFPRIFALAALLGSIGCATQADLQRQSRESENIRRVAADSQAATASLKRDVDALRGEIEQLRYQSGFGGQMTEELVAEIEALDLRLAMVEAKRRGAVGVTEPGTVVGIAGPDSTRIAIATALLDPNLPPDFREALSLLQNGRVERSVPMFRDFLRRSPGSELADDAQYWVGEAYYSVKEYNRAILELNDVLLRYPKADRVPGALLRQASAFKELGDQVDAKLVLQKLVSDHPGTREAEDGRRLLLDLSP